MFAFEADNWVIVTQNCAKPYLTAVHVNKPHVVVARVHAARLTRKRLTIADDNRHRTVENVSIT